MANLIKLSTAIERMVPSSRNFVELALKQQINKYKNEDARFSIASIAQKACVLSGFKDVAPEDLKIIADDVYKRCIERFPLVTIEEISEAINNGIHGDYGDYFGINAKSIFMFIQSYVKNADRMDALKEYHKKNKPHEIPPPLTRGQWKELILRDYELLKNGDLNLIIFTPKKYLLLQAEGLVRIKPERWEYWLLRAKEERIYKKTRLSKLKGNTSEANEYKKIFDTLELTGDIPDNEVIHIENDAKNLIYLEFLKRMATEGVINFFTE